MSKYKRMSDEEYFLAMDEFISRYNAPQCEPIKQLDLLLSREEADEILLGKRKTVVRPFNDQYFDCLTDYHVDEWMTAHRDSFGMDMEAFTEFMCATRPVEKIHFHDEQNTWYIDVTCRENALIPATRINIQDLNDRFGCIDLNRLFMEVANGKEAHSEPPLYYYFAIGDIIGTEKDKTDDEETTPIIIKLKRPFD